MLSKIFHWYSIYSVRTVLVYSDKYIENSGQPSAYKTISLIPFAIWLPDKMTSPWLWYFWKMAAKPRCGDVLEGNLQ